MKRSIISLLVSSAMFCAYANADDLFEYETQGLRSLEKGVHHIRVNKSAVEVVPGATFNLRSPSGEEGTVHVDSVSGTENSKSVSGHIVGVENSSVVLTVGTDSVFGSIVFGENAYSIEGTSLLDLRTMNLTLEKCGQDIYPDPNNLDHNTVNSVVGQHHTKANASTLPNNSVRTTITLLVQYTQGMLTRYSTEAGTKARIDSLVAVANTALTNSGVNMEYKVLSYEKSDVSDTALTNIALGSGFTWKTTSRNKVGADLVITVRPFKVSHGSCGGAFILGGGVTNLAAASEAVGAIVDEGRDSGYYCDDDAFAHELGHNMGLAHDRAHASGVASKPYAYGFSNLVGSKFGTVMSYQFPKVRYFSNPDIKCNGIPCGVADTDANSANNAEALILNKDIVANFRTVPIVQAPFSATSVASGDPITSFNLSVSMNPDTNDLNQNGYLAVKVVSGVSTTYRATSTSYSVSFINFNRTAYQLVNGQTNEVLKGYKNANPFAVYFGYSMTPNINPTNYIKVYEKK